MFKAWKLALSVATTKSLIVWTVISHGCYYGATMFVCDSSVSHVSTQMIAQLRSFKESWFIWFVVSLGKRDLQVLLTCSNCCYRWTIGGFGFLLCRRYELLCIHRLLGRGKLIWVISFTNGVFIFTFIFMKYWGSHCNVCVSQFVQRVQCHGIASKKSPMPGGWKFLGHLWIKRCFNLCGFSSLSWI